MSQVEALGSNSQSFNGFALDWVSGDTSVIDVVVEHDITVYIVNGNSLPDVCIVNFLLSPMSFRTKNRVWFIYFYGIKVDQQFFAKLPAETLLGEPEIIPKLNEQQAPVSYEFILPAITEPTPIGFEIVKLYNLHRYVITPKNVDLVPSVATVVDGSGIYVTNPAPGEWRVNCAFGVATGVDSAALTPVAGPLSVPTGNFNLIYGKDSSSTFDNNILIGNNTSLGFSNTVNVGNFNNIQGDQVCVGHNAVVTGGDVSIVGNDNSATYSTCIIGNFNTCTDGNNIVIGNANTAVGYGNIIMDCTNNSAIMNHNVKIGAVSGYLMYNDGCIAIGNHDPVTAPQLVDAPIILGNNNDRDGYANAEIIIGHGQVPSGNPRQLTLGVATVPGGGPILDPVTTSGNIPVSIDGVLHYIALFPAPLA